jgi:inosine-uridine nucleoside N-ribohydrolase
MNRIPVIMDVDTGLDDALAILLASDCPQLHLLGIACVSGNVPVEDTYTNTKYIVKLLELKIPVSKGAAYPLINKVLHAHEVHGKSGLGRVSITAEYEKHILLASQMYERLLTEAQEPVTIIATGPLTNLAHLIKNHPNLIPKIKAISFMGGSLGAGNVTKHAEFNAHFDPEAVDIVLKSGVPLTMAGLQLTTKIRMNTSMLEGQITGPLPTQAFYLDLLDFYIGNAIKRGHPEGGALHDSIAVASVAYPELFKSEMKSVMMDVSKEERRGETREEGEIQNVLALISVDPQSLIKLTVDSIRHLRRTE